MLVVAVNTDESVQRLKGPTRPINSLEDRLQVLAGLSSVDFLISFDDQTPARLLEILKPDVFVKGGDYTRETLPEAAVVEAYGGSVSDLALHREPLDDRHDRSRIRPDRYAARCRLRPDAFAGAS